MILNLIKLMHLTFTPWREQDGQTGDHRQAFLGMEKSSEALVTQKGVCQVWLGGSQVGNQLEASSWQGPGS